MTTKGSGAHWTTYVILVLSFVSPISLFAGTQWFRARDLSIELARQQDMFRITQMIGDLTARVETAEISIVEANFTADDYGALVLELEREQQIRFPDLKRLRSGNIK